MDYSFLLTRVGFSWRHIGGGKYQFVNGPVKITALARNGAKPGHDVPLVQFRLEDGTPLTVESLIRTGLVTQEQVESAMKAGREELWKNALTALKLGLAEEVGPVDQPDSFDLGEHGYFDLVKSGVQYRIKITDVKPLSR